MKRKIFNVCLLVILAGAMSLGMLVLMSGCTHAQSQETVNDPPAFIPSTSPATPTHIPAVAKKTSNVKSAPSIAMATFVLVQSGETIWTGTLNLPPPGGKLTIEVPANPQPTAESIAGEVVKAIRDFVIGIAWMILAAIAIVFIANHWLRKTSFGQGIALLEAKLLKSIMGHAEFAKLVAKGLADLGYVPTLPTQAPSETAQ